jgi:hypothetical protein
MEFAVSEWQFDPPDWPVTLASLAAVLLGGELALLVLRFRRRGAGHRSALAWTAAAIGAGPLMAMGGLVRSVISAADGNESRQEGRLWLWGGLRGSALLAMGVAVYRAPTGGSLLVLLVLGGTWCVRAMRNPTRPISPRHRRLLLALRLGVLVLLGLWALNPVDISTRRERIPPAVLIGVDRSASMAIRDMPPPAGGEAISRYEALQNTFRRLYGAWEQLADTVDLNWYTFAGRAHDPIRRSQPPTEPADPTGAVTAIGDTLQSAYDQLAATGADVRAVVLLSDGCNNTVSQIAPEILAERLGRAGTTLHTVQLGQDTPAEKLHVLRVQNLQAPQTVDAFSRFSVTGQLEAIGLAGRTVMVALRFAGQTIATLERTVAQDRQTMTLNFSHTPIKTGFHRLELEAMILGDPPKGLSGQFRIDQPVQVVDRQIRVLYLEGRVRYESRYIALALGSDRRIALRRVLLGDRRGAVQLGEDLDDWLPYHAFILGDLPAGRLSRDQLDRIAQCVDEYGKGVVMIGGKDSYAAGGWAGTAVGDLLGIDVAASRGQINQPVKIRPTEAGLDSAVMAQAATPAGTADAWNRLAALDGANRLVGLKPAAVVLARSQRNEPMIVAQSIGTGRSLAVAIDTTWRWVLTPEETAPLQRRFWRQVVEYLANPRGHCWVQTDRTRYNLAELAADRQQVLIHAGIEDARGHSTTSDQATLTLTGPDAAPRPVPLQTAEGQYRATLPPPEQPGTYRLDFTAELAGETLKASQQFEIIRRDLEAAQPLADKALLTRLAASSGGRAVGLDALGDVLAELRTTLQPRYKQFVRRRSLLDPWAWWLWTATLLMLAGEWIIRKRNNLA